MYKNLKRAAVAAAFAFAITSGLSAQTPPPKPLPAAPAPLKVGFVFVSPVGEAGWTYQHNQGRLDLEKNLGARVQTTFVENVAEGADSERVMRDLAAQGHRLIIASSFGYLEPALKVAADFPQVAFEHAGGYKTAANLNTYNARYYEGRYLAGLIAGRMTRSGTAGYVAGFPVPEVVQGINAFARGLREANPQAQLRVIWLNAWFDPAREREAALTLMRQGADVITNHSGSTAVAQTVEAEGRWFIGYQSDMRRFAPKRQLTAVTHHWGGYYTRVAQAMLDGRWTPTPAWGGLKDGFIDLAPLHPEIPADVAKLVRERRQAIEEGRFHPFAGRIVDNQGRVRHEGGPMDDRRIAAMDYYVEGVVGQLPGR